MILAPRHLPRLAATVGLFTRYGLADFAKQQGLAGLDHEPEPGDDHGGSPERAAAFRKRLVELGPAYVKLGQVLSTRPDLLPPTYIQELERLQDDVGEIPIADVEQIIDTLLDNAAVYARGPVEVATGTSDGHAWIAVRDHGPGMPEAVRERATERFYRSPGAPPGGSGLGLAIVRELAEGDGGDVSIEMPDDGGTRIEIRYPRVLTEA